jgi:hypothetical protein
MFAVVAVHALAAGLFVRAAAAARGRSHVADVVFPALLLRLTFRSTPGIHA